MEGKILSNIKKCIERHLINNINHNYSLLGGDAGQVMFLFYLSQKNNCEYEKICGYLDMVLSSVNQRSVIPTYCNGIAGLCIGLMALEDDGFIEDAKAAVSVYDKYLTDTLNKMLKIDLDFLHGAIGIGLNFINRAASDDEAYSAVINILDNLERSAIKTENGEIYWLYPDRYRRLEQNLSISHGICSTSIFIARVYKILRSEEDKERCIKLLKGIGQYLISNLMNPKEFECYTPNKNKKGKTRLGWCYGDMGTSIALRAIGEIASDSSILDLSYNIALYTARNRNDLKSDMIYDACLCHGSSGVANFFHNCYEYYNDVEFSEAYKKWRKITIDMYDNINGEPMFGHYRFDTARKHKCLDVLEGDAGVGLMLLGEHSLLDNLLLYKY